MVESVGIQGIDARVGAGGGREDARLQVEELVVDREIGAPELKKTIALRRPGTPTNDDAAVSSVRSVRRARSRASSATSSVTSTLPSSISVVDVRRTFIGSALRFAFAPIARWAGAALADVAALPGEPRDRALDQRQILGRLLRVSPRPVVVTTDTRSPGWT